MGRKQSRHISDPVKNHLWQNSAGRCAFPNCRMKVSIPGNALDTPATIGDIAHIYSYSDGGPRPNPDGFTKESNEYDNLLLLCKNHHRQVDVQSNTYTVTMLRQWKSELEHWVDEQLRLTEFGYKELAQIITWLAEADDRQSSIDVDLTPIRLKISRNGFSERITNLVSTGVSRRRQVKNYVNHQAQIDPRYPERLLGPLMARYNELRQSTSNSDHIFSGMRQFASGNSTEFELQSAGLVLIVYFFELYDIFEK